MKKPEPKSFLSYLTLLIILGSGIWQLYRFSYGDLPVNHDPIRGFEVLDQMREGGEWNTLEYPGVGSSADYSMFLSWWTPGQYMLPAITEMFWTRQTSMAFWMLLSWVSFLSGIFFLSRSWSIPTSVTWLVILILTWHPETFLGLWEYKGGGSFLLGYLPWYILFLFKLDPTDVRGFWLWSILTLLGVFLKSAFILWGLGAGIYILFRLWKTGKLDMRRGGHLVLSSLVALLPVLWFISMGETPNQAVDSRGFFDMGNHLVADILVPPVMSIFSGWPIGDEMIRLDRWFREMGFGAFVVLIPLFILGVTLIMVQKKVLIIRVFEFLVIHILLFWLIFTYWYLTDKAISYEPRHFYPLGVLILITTIFWMIRVLGKVAHVLIIIGVILYGYGQWNGRWEYFKEGFMASDGIRYPTRYKVGFDVLADLNKDLSANTLFLIEANWHYTRAISGTDRIAIGKYDGRWKINPGVELDELPNAGLVGFSRYNRIIHLCGDAQYAYRPVGFSEVSRKQIEDGHWIIEWERI